MKSHTRQVAIATLVALTFLMSSASIARAEDFATYSGARLYARFCAACHGDQGRGDGVVAASFKIMVPDLTRLAKRRDGTFPEADVRRIIDGTKNMAPHGAREMPVWGFEFYAQNEGRADPKAETAQMIERLTQYLKSIQAP